MSVLHVTNGESAAGTLRDTVLAGEVLSWDDVLTEGPLVRNGFVEARARFLGECGWGAAPTIRESFEERDRRLADALASDGVLLWFEHDLFDQLQLVQILARLGASATAVELINTNRFLGELTASELEALWPERRAVTPELVALASGAWDVLCAEEPTAIEHFLTQDTSALPFLAAALHRFLQELPDTTSGLARSERELLEPLLEERRTPLQLFVDYQRKEEAPFDGDAWVYRRLAKLAPLIAPANDGALPTPPPLGDTRFTSVRLALTDAGRDVLDGKADRVELIGIDRWLGGTHVTPENVWRWNGELVVR